MVIISIHKKNKIIGSISYLKILKNRLPSRITSGTQDIFGSFDVNGDATDASASDNDIPACAVLKAPQSFAPSPHMAT